MNTKYLVISEQNGTTLRFSATYPAAQMIAALWLRSHTANKGGKLMAFAKDGSRETAPKCVWGSCGGINVVIDGITVHACSAIDCTAQEVA